MTLAAGKSPTSGGVATRLAFFKGLQAITTRIHATHNIDEIIFELSADLCELFGAERLTIYTVDDARNAIVSKVKMGLHKVNSIRLPISENSIAGYVAYAKKMLNIPDVYDEAALRAISPHLEFRKEVDEVTGYHSKQMLVAPIVSNEKGELEGVLQLINSVDGQPFTPIAEEGLLGLAQTLGVAFAQRTKAPAAPRSRYDLLVTEAKITREELDAATRKARERKVPTEEVLIEDMGLGQEEIGQAVATFFNVKYEPFHSDRIKPVDLLVNIKREFVEQSHWLPLEENEEGVVIMATDPEQIRASRVAHNVFPNKNIVIRATTVREFRKTVDQFFEASLDMGSVDDLLSDLVEDEQDSSMAEELSAAADNELVKLVNKVIVDAYKQGASDIHIEPRPGKEKTLIRFRKDGTLVPYIEVPASYRNPLVTRIKIMCDLDISERRKPQDGKIKFRKYSPLDIELRVATLPTAGGLEDVVMRILANSEPIPLDKLGLTENNLSRLMSAITKPYGIFFVCGPTGSGKTTTLHSILGHINTPDTKIWTAEDPVEITQKGLRQVQVNRKAGLDFATMMRAFLRADPDVIMVGEMRDHETVAVGLEASLTGHLVFSTLHTNSAPESIVRLLDMGMDPFNFADALLGVLAQRLAKRLCPKCKAAYHPDVAEMSNLLDEYCLDLQMTTPFKEDADAARKAVAKQWQTTYADKQGQFTFYKPVGCDDCTKGYRGRVGLHELMLGTDDTKKRIQERARVAELLALALEEGMRTLRQDGIEKVLAGITDMAQVRKVCVR
ncbi:GspE/PulE family protein [Nitrogeniibacter mangrovi]|uniref:GspE/PulE family protein n=1 Tax=Nitrogeniibacter mangrovi TaxID=2016596 RepID=A0A6C1B5L0_9RHOO|nr:GspE/PulE family protein [Nitrogeniibacter mangrovi]QID18757.1 GspE/PulE family protein [Nitrogeniibacter mangrovi]